MNRAWLLLLCLSASASAQETRTPNDIQDLRSGAHALVGATVIPEPGGRIEAATLLVRDGRVVSVRAGGPVPDGYVRIDLDGRYVYPGLIELDSGYGLPEPAPRAPFSFSAPEVIESQTTGAYNANQAIRSEYRAAAEFHASEEAAANLRKLGFGAALVHRADGIARGTGALVSLSSGSDNELLLKADAATLYSFDKGSSSQSFPISNMGAIALLRQTFLDAEWYAAQQPKPFVDQSLEAWNAHAGLPRIFTVGDWRSLLRADRVGDEFGVQYIIRGAGDEYRRIDAVVGTGAPLIIDLDFPEAEDVSDPLAAESIDFADLKHWELAPGNPAALAEAGVPFALTSAGKDKTFWPNLRKAIQRGLSEDEALAALTVRPARWLGVEDRLGRIVAGAEANLLITSGPLFEDQTVIQENWIGGRRHVIQAAPQDRSGEYELAIGGGDRYPLRVAGPAGKHKATLPPLADGEDRREVEIAFDGELVTLGFSPEEGEAPIRLTGWIDERGWQGRGQLGDGRWVDWSASRTGDLEDQPEKDEADGAASEPFQPGPVTYPFQAYGRVEPPVAEDVVFRKATVWTSEEAGVLAEADVLVRNGKITAVGNDLNAGGAREIDASGKHLTAGLIDEHSHIALDGVNDIATNSGMVRMSDVIDSDDINIYRNLAGGVTAAQLLHGSANPVGGQSALVKFRWGALPSEMLIEGADGFIKFALGENVKRSRNPNSIRYPQTRMGVEQVYRNAFTAARDYQAEWAEYRGLSRREQASTPPPRRDLVLDTMVEILEGERFITCHSYVQSEINMLMHVADDFGFNVNTFTHILEGYKVADKMAAHGAGGSTFSDWWAYKWEVRYAIPYGPALMSEAGVTVAVNSDSSEMSRRLNQEAAKSVKYGGMSEEEALKLVTLNPARLLHLDDRMGSIREGKDADLVVWSDHPLSIYAVPEMTLVDGTVYYDRAEDARLRESIRTERARLIAAMAREKPAGNGGNGGGRPARQEWHCDSLTGYEHLSDQWSVQ